MTSNSSVPHRSGSWLWMILLPLAISCSKGGPEPIPSPPFSVREVKIGTTSLPSTKAGTALDPSIRVSFNAPLDRSSATTGIVLMLGSLTIPSTITFESNDSAAILKPNGKLKGLERYKLSVLSTLSSKSGSEISDPGDRGFITGLDTADKFPRISDEALLDTLQKSTLNYFLDLAFPGNSMARERNANLEVVTTGGTGFGVMAMLAGAQRGFMTRTDARDRVKAITDFLLNRCPRYHGAFSHWIYGGSGATVPFSANDNGGDIVETSYLLTGLLCARQYFTGSDPVEQSIRTTVDTLWNQMEWNWYRQNAQDVLYWHWSIDKGWVMNMPVKGWNEALITYVLAASSPRDSIPASAYHNGWAGKGSIRNPSSFYGFTLPLGPADGGPMFWSQYSFLGIDPHGLSDDYADYWQQVSGHALSNLAYCKANPKGYYGYSGDCWGLTACDVPNGYQANSPNNDPGVIAPTAALSSMPYSPEASMAALRFMYYKLGDKIWNNRLGFQDAFKLDELWYSGSYLAIDQGPIVAMVENHRSGLLWDLFMSCPEIKAGMRRLGFKGPRL
jgi:hypothetical protein